jgi:hypothetical protein
MASGIFNQFKMNLMRGKHDMDVSGNDMYVALMDTNHTAAAWTSTDGWPAATAGIRANEISTVIGTVGYTAGGQALGTKAVSQESTHGKFTAANSSWTTATFTANYAIIWDDTVTVDSPTAADPLIAEIDFNGDQIVTSGTFTIQWHADGIIKIT